MATFSQWLDDYAGSDNIVAGVATIWRTAKGDEDARPRVSAVQSITAWLREHRGVADESLRAAVRSFNEARGGRQATEAEVGAFRAMNEPGTIAPVPGDHEQPELHVMAALGRIERALGAPLATDQGTVHERLSVIEGRLMGIADLLAPFVSLFAEEQAPDQGELDGQVADAMLATDEPVPGAGEPSWRQPEPQVTGSLWRNIVAPEPDPERMAQLGDPRLVEDEG